MHDKCSVHDLKQTSIIFHEQDCSVVKSNLIFHQRQVDIYNYVKDKESNGKNTLFSSWYAGRTVSVRMQIQPWHTNSHSFFPNVIDC